MCSAASSYMQQCVWSLAVPHTHHSVRMTHRPRAAREPKNIPQKVSCVMINKVDFTMKLWRHLLKLVTSLTTGQKKPHTIHQLPTMLCTSYCWHTGQCVGSSAPVVSKWLLPRYRTFLEVASMVVTWWIYSVFLCCECKCGLMCIL